MYEYTAEPHTQDWRELALLDECDDSATPEQWELDDFQDLLG